MLEENKEKKGFLERPTTRRQFLKIGCQTVAGAAVSASLLSLFTDSAEATGLAVASGLLISEPHRCTGCRRCETVCTITNDGKADPYISRVKVARNYNFGPEGPQSVYWQSSGHYGDQLITPDTCRQCEDPVPCASICPMQAIGTDAFNTRVVDEDKCIGCGLCTNACPWQVITVDPQDRKAKKCFLCNGDPACAANCPSGALRLIPWEKVAAVVRESGQFFV